MIEKFKRAKIFKILPAAFILCANTSVYAQTSRTEAMGGLNYSIIDQDNSLTPYDFAGNPAWLYADKEETYLDITPSLSNSWGNFRRRFASEGTYNLKTDFEGVKTLDSLGTFLGKAVYSYENRRNYYRILKKDPYTGEGFFLTDTTAGDFRYNGPTMMLMYSWELFPRLYTGGSVSYGILEGLKDKFSYAKTLYREIDVNAGLAYRFSERFIAGALAEYYDSQESIESHDINSYPVLVHNYRGDKYFIPYQSATVAEKEKKNKTLFGGHLYYEAAPSVQIAARASYAYSLSTMFKPYASLIIEEARASFEIVDVQVQSRFILSKDFLVALNFTYAEGQSWTKTSWSNLLLWDWNTKQASFGAGASYRITPPLLLAAECEYARSNLDSSKYIDHRFVSLISNDVLFKAGAEYVLNSGLILRAGYNRGFYEEDPVYGGKDVIFDSYTAGIGINILDIMFNAHINYASYFPDNSSGKKRSSLGGYLSMRLKSF